jgi:hypothetical protein
MNLINVIKEEVSLFINEVAWEESVKSQIQAQRIPLTRGIGEILYGEANKVRAFHITDIEGALMLKKIQGTQKSISTFTCMDKQDIIKVRGIKTRGGVLCEIVGDLIIQTTKDIWSHVDEKGTRWADVIKFFVGCGDLMDEWSNVTDKFRKFHRGYDPATSIQEYFHVADNFFMKHKHEILSCFSNDKDTDEVWNELLVNNIIIGDMYWNGDGDMNDELWDKYGDNYDTYNKKYYEWYETVLKQLNTVSSGTVYHINQEDMTPERFFEEKGGSFTCMTHKIAAE